MRRRVLVGSSILVFALLLQMANGLAGAAPTPQRESGAAVLPRDPGKGGRLFLSKGCIRCHSVFGEGGSIGPDLGRSTRGLNLPELAATMWNHTPSMGRELGMLNLDRPQFERGEMGALTAFIYYLNFAPRGDGDAARGRELFRSKGCERCHAIAGRGQEIGPPLDEIADYLSPVILTQRMWNHGPVMIELSRDMGLRVPELSARELQDLVAHLRASSLVASEGAAFLRPGDARRGNELFQSRGCAFCHPNGHARGRYGAPDLSRARFGTSVLDLASRLWNHMPAMYTRMERASIGVPEFSELEMTDLLAYLHSLDYGGGEADPVRGARLLESKGCQACHALVGATGQSPDLSTSQATRSMEEGIRALWNHAPAMLRNVAETRVDWPRLTGDEVRDILGYIRTLRE